MRNQRTTGYLLEDIRGTSRICEGQGYETRKMALHRFGFLHHWAIQLNATYIIIITVALVRIRQISLFILSDRWDGVSDHSLHNIHILLL